MCATGFLFNLANALQQKRKSRAKIVNGIQQSNWLRARGLYHCNLQLELAQLISRHTTLLQYIIINTTFDYLCIVATATHGR